MNRRCEIQIRDKVVLNLLGSEIECYCLARSLLNSSLCFCELSQERLVCTSGVTAKCYILLPTQFDYNAQIWSFVGWGAGYTKYVHSYTQSVRNVMFILFLRKKNWLSLNEIFDQCLEMSGITKLTSKASGINNQISIWQNALGD